MQYLFTIAEMITSMDINVEIMMFLCSVVLYFVLQSVRKPHMERKDKNANFLSASDTTKPRAEADAKQKVSNPDTSTKISTEGRNTHYAQIDKALHIAFEAEDYWQVLKCWNALKKFDQCPSHIERPCVNVLQLVKSMQCCNKDAHFIVGEVRQYFKAYPRKRNIGNFNDLLEPLARRLDDSQLVDLISCMLPSINLVKDSRTYEILLTMHVAKRNLPRAEDIIAEMRANEAAFTPCATVAVMTMALQVGNLDLVLKAFKKLKVSWDVRSTWAVSPFALQGHKTRILTEIVDLACRNRKLGEVLPMLEGMTVPEQALKVVGVECASLGNIELVTMFKLLAKSGQAQFMDCLDSRSKALVLSTTKTVEACSDDASTSEGSRSDSEEGEEWQR
jgi:hypothetical protein